jgi:sec-independent protein translocase protein TatA
MNIGVWELVLILAVVVLLFGTGKLTRSMGDLARGFRSFKDGMKDATGEAEATQSPPPPPAPPPAALPPPNAVASRGDAAEVGRHDQPARP